MPKDDGRLLLDPEYLSGTGDPHETYEPVLTEEERRYFPNLVSLEDCLLEADILGAAPVFEAHVLLTGHATLHDGHDGSLVGLDIDDGVDLVLDLRNPDDSDLVPEKDGGYDLRGTFLSLLHDAVPSNYSKVPLRRVETDDFVLMSEEEYEDSRKRTNGFAALKDYEIDEK